MVIKILVTNIVSKGNYSMTFDTRFYVINTGDSDINSQQISDSVYVAKIRHEDDKKNKVYDHVTRLSFQNNINFTISQIRCMISFYCFFCKDFQRIISFGCNKGNSCECRSIYTTGAIKLTKK